jgi:hypothetical protein
MCIANLLRHFNVEDFTLAAAPDALVSLLDSTASIARSFRSMCGSFAQLTRMRKQALCGSDPACRTGDGK